MCITDYTPTTFFYLQPFMKKLADDQYSSITNWQYLPYQTYVHITLYHGSGLTWNWMFNGSILYVQYLHVLQDLMWLLTCIRSNQTSLGRKLLIKSFQVIQVSHESPVHVPLYQIVTKNKEHEWVLTQCRKLQRLEHIKRLTVEHVKNC